MKPVFIVGCPRTGSKIYMHILRAHSEIDIMPEIHFMDPFWLHRDFVRNVKKKVGNLKDDSNIPRLIDLMYSGKLFGSFWKMIDLDKEILQNEIMDSDRSFESVFKVLLREHAVSQGKTVPGAKFPVHFSYTLRLLEWFPECRIIHLIRDPRAIYSSQAHRYIPKEPQSILRSTLIKSIMFVYVSVIYRWAVKMHNRLKHLDNYCLSRYEDVVGKPEKHLRELCHFLEIDFRQDMLCPPIMDSSYDRSQGQIGFDRESIDRWRKYISPISAKLIAMINRKSMRKTGYL